MARLGGPIVLRHAVFRWRDLAALDRETVGHRHAEPHRFLARVLVRCLPTTSVPHDCQHENDRRRYPRPMFRHPASRWCHRATWAVFSASNAEEYGSGGPGGKPRTTRAEGTRMGIALPYLGHGVGLRT